MERRSKRHPSSPMRLPGVRRKEWGTSQRAEHSIHMAAGELGTPHEKHLIVRVDFPSAKMQEVIRIPLEHVGVNILDHLMNVIVDSMARQVWKLEQGKR